MAQVTRRGLEVEREADHRPPDPLDPLGRAREVLPPLGLLAPLPRVDPQFQPDLRALPAPASRSTRLPGTRGGSSTRTHTSN